jgi:protein TonB
LKRVGGGVSAPEVLFAPEPEFSEEARRSKVSGNVLVYLQVDEQGRPMHVRVLRGLGMGLDEKALEAVRQYRFRPAMENGKPVAVEMNVDVTFNIY